jgi:multidrug efflux pump subunit AcrA (membrane-fusion protein)
MSSRSLPVDSDPANACWHELEDLLDELAEVSKSGTSAGEFYRLLAERLVGALGVSGAAIWTGRPDELRLEYQVNLTTGATLPSAEALAPHQPPLEEALRTRQPRVVPPGGATTAWLVFHPFAVGSTTGAIELVERREMTAAGGRNYVQILHAVVELVEDFHRHRELGELRGRAETWRQFDRFALRVHESLDVDQTAFLIANDARRLIGCDRVSVLVRHGNKYRATAASGVDSLDRRAKSVALLERLAGRCAAAGETVWYHEGVRDIPAEIEQPLDAYLDESHARTLVVVPLCEPRAEGDSRAARVIGVLAAEQFQATAAPVELRERVAAVSEHSAAALANALVYSRLPLARLGRALAKVRWLAEARQLPKTALALAGIAAVAAALVLVPADFNVEAKGTFEPRLQRDVFAPDDGIVERLLVDHGRKVRAGEPLVELRQPELDLEFRRVAGETQTAEKKLAAVRAERLENAPAGPDARRRPHELAAEEEELKELLKGLAEQKKLLDAQRADLVVRSPIDGEALTWNIKQLLEARPVERGQALLTIGDLSGPWVLELDVPDDRAGFVLEARENLKRDLDVSFRPVAEPGSEFHGRIVDVALSTELDELNEPKVLVTVDFDKQAVSGLRPGATALAHVHCGRRSIGFVWLHDLYHYVQSLWW